MSPARSVRSSIGPGATVAALLKAGRRVAGGDAWPRALLSAAQWRKLYEGLRQGRLDLVALWGETGCVHLAARDDERAAVFSLSCPGGAYPSLGKVHAPAIRLERALADLVGLRPEGLPDERPWLDHGRWPISHPLSPSPGAPRRAADPYAFLPVEGEGLHEVSVGPVHAGIIEPGHFQVTANGETIARLEERLGYAHKGVAALMRGAPLDRAARLAGRISGDSTVAYAYAFALAVEKALGVETPRRAQWLRALMAELERLANHLGDIGAICNDAAFVALHAHCGMLREQVLRACDAAFGHRLMMDRISPGGASADVADGGIGALAAAASALRRDFAGLVEIYDETNSLQDRVVGTGIVRPEWARRFAAGGFVGRAAGRSFDARKQFPYELYRELAFETPVRSDGDINARVWVRIREVEQSLAMLDQLLSAPPDGPWRVELPTPADPGLEGAALVEGFRGDVFLWIRLDGGGVVEACWFRDPSWFQWPLLEAAIEGAIVGDFPLCNKSFNCAYSGHDG
jgi:Ni,Fe-hydrogenase III large subunit